MEKVLDLLAKFYPITLAVLGLGLYKWNYLDQTSKPKSWLSNLLIIFTIIHLVCFYANYGFEDVWFWIWLGRDVLILVLAIFLYEYPKWRIAFVLFFLGFAGYWLYENHFIISEKFISTSSDKTEIAADSSAELIVQIYDPAQFNTLRNILEKTSFPFEIHEAFPHISNQGLTELDNCYTINLPNDEAAKQVYELLKKQNNIKTVEWNEPYQLSPIETNATPAPNPPRSFHFINDEKSAEQWALEALEIDELAKQLRRLRPKKVAKIFILDTGIDANHEDLKENYFSVKPEYDKDTDSHGTHCAGIAACVTNNQRGVASLNFDNRFCKITSITVLPRGRGRQENIIDGMIMAVDLGADVISMSLGGPNVDTKQSLYEQAVDYCNKKGAIVVVAAGNKNEDAKKHVPAACNNTITVAAVDENLQKASFSNYFSEQHYPLCAPGVNILSTVPNNNYKFFNGTSMATPYVAGVLGIMKAIKPELSTEQAFQILRQSGKKLNTSENIGTFIQPSDAIRQLLHTRGNFHWLIEWLIKFFTFKR